MTSTKRRSYGKRILIPVRADIADALSAFFFLRGMTLQEAATELFDESVERLHRDAPVFRQVLGETRAADPTETRPYNSGISLPRSLIREGRQFAKARGKTLSGLTGELLLKAIVLDNGRRLPRASRVKSRER
jgi:hypothetical protein